MKLRSKKDRLRNYLKAKYGMKFENGGVTGGEGGEDTEALIAALKRATSEPPAEERPSRMGGAEILSGDPIKGDLLGTRLASETTQAGAGMAPVGYGERYSDVGGGEPRREVVQEDVPERPEDMVPLDPRRPRVGQDIDKELIPPGERREGGPSPQRNILYEQLRNNRFTYDRPKSIMTRDNYDKKWSVVQDPATLESVAYDIGQQRDQSFGAFARDIQKEKGWDDQETNLRLALMAKGRKDWKDISSDDLYDMALDSEGIDIRKFLEGRATGNIAPARAVYQNYYPTGKPENIQGKFNTDFAKGMSGMKLLKRGR